MTWLHVKWNYFSPRRRPSEIILFQRVPNFLKNSIQFSLFIKKTIINYNIKHTSETDGLTCHWQALAAAEILKSHLECKNGVKSQLHVHNRRVKELSDAVHLTEFGKALQLAWNYFKIIWEAYFPTLSNMFCVVEIILK